MIALALVAGAAGSARAQAPDSRWSADVGFGFEPSINGNVNSGVIGTLQGQATAILPSSYSDVYGSGFTFHFGGGYALNENTELRGVFTWQSADADLVRLGDLGPSSLYGQYSDYKVFALDVGARRYFSPVARQVRPFAEVMIGAAWVDRINVLLSAPRANVIFDSTNFYDATAAFTWKLGFGALLKVSNQVDLTGEVGLRHVGGLAQVDQFIGTGLEDINDDTGRLTFPITFGVRYRF